MVYSHPDVDVEMCVHAQDHLGLGFRSPGADHRHVCSSFRCGAHFPPEEQERTDECAVRGHVSGASSYEVTTLRLRGPWSDTKAFGQGVTCKAPLAHLVGGSGRSEASPTAILQDTHSLVGKFPEVGLPIYGVLRSSLSHLPLYSMRASNLYSIRASNKSRIGAIRSLGSTSMVQSSRSQEDRRVKE
jgi:hypothetical protein